jgi:hypothetical protein
MIHVRIVSTYPPAFGLPEETTDLTYELQSEFAVTPNGAQKRIERTLDQGEVVELPVLGKSRPVRFSADVVRFVAVW